MTGIYRTRSQNSFYLDIACGCIDGYSTMNKFGENPEIDTDSDPEDIWDYGGVYTFSSSANNTAVTWGFDLILINN